jgi:hypothetical protein
VRVCACVSLCVSVCPCVCPCVCVCVCCAVVPVCSPLRFTYMNMSLVLLSLLSSLCVEVLSCLANAQDTYGMDVPPVHALGSRCGGGPGPVDCFHKISSLVQGPRISIYAAHFDESIAGFCG